MDIIEPEVEVISIRSAELSVVNPDARDELLGYYVVEVYGLLSRLHGKNYAQAHFGTFEPSGDRSLLYSATVWTDKDGQIAHDYDSEFEDDLRMLIADRCERFN